MQKVSTLTGHTFRVLYLAMSPDGNTIVVKEEKILGPEILFNPSIIGLENLCTYYSNP